MKWFKAGLAVVVFSGCLAGNAGESGDGKTGGAGEIKLFNGKDLTGWTLMDQTLADTWSVRDGVLVDSGKPAGYIRTEASYKNFILRLKVRHITKGNGGVLIRMVGADKKWPKSIEAQGMYENMGDIWNIDNFPMKTDPERTKGRRTLKMNPSNERPLGEWNDYEIKMAGGRLEISVNGLLQNTADDVEEVEGKIGLQSEGAQMEFKDIMLEVLP